MKSFVAISGLMASVVLLGGCAGTTGGLNAFGRALESVGNASPIHKHYVYQVNKTQAPLPADLEHPATVWVPAAYTGDGQAHLYINGRPLYLRGEIANVASFVKSRGGYLVAIRENNLRVSGQPMPLQRPGIVFYRVSVKGALEHQVGYFVTSPFTQVVNTGKAIYLQETEGTTSQPVLYRYVGYSESGRQVSGPQGVPFASPTPHGGWFVEEITGRSGYFDVTPGYKAKILLESKTGGVTVVTPQLNVPYHERSWIHTTSAFVDEAPVTDTARTGVILRLYTGRYSGLDLVKLDQPMKQTCEGLIGKICQHQGVYDAAVTGFVNPNTVRLSTILFGSPGQPYLAMPYQIGGPTPYGVVNAAGAMSGASKGQWIDLFPARGAVRGNYALPAYGIIGPGVAVIVNADAGSTVAGLSYEIQQSSAGENVSVLNPNRVSQFLASYGFRQVPVLVK
ncbi:hypothetical protein BJI67_16195 (plasmid) [Acidihalobacter aeolianus]|uniref:Uncharacterized protein n=1 Tax=Acidihalobacter aeolianus TaxID=2792603 RepID=A0A1D8KCU1_9GAMM|nr:hypothetical protein [Acidihalobacter aeolianus]AOV18779.1 hypothetical protein BJI67_16195 [Acidihalobacter aeolianus]